MSLTKFGQCENEYCQEVQGEQKITFVYDKYSKQNKYLCNWCKNNNNVLKQCNSCDFTTESQQDRFCPIHGSELIIIPPVKQIPITDTIDGDS